MMNKAKLHTIDILDEILAEITPEESDRTTKRMELAARISDGIKANGWKKKDFAEAMHKQPSEITKWLSGTHNFTSDTLFDIERVLNMGLVSLKDVPKTQVIKYQVVVSQKAIILENPSYFDLSTNIYMGHLYEGTKSHQYSVNSNN